MITTMVRRLFRRRNSKAAELQPKFSSLALHEGCTVMIHDTLHRWNGKAAFVVALSDPSDPFELVTIQRNGDVEFFRPRQLSTRLAFAFSYETALQP